MTITDALAFWHGKDLAPLAAAITPPCDVLGDDAYDPALALWFYRLVGKRTTTERLFYIDQARRAQQHTIETLRSTGDHYGDHIDRVQRVIDVLDRWSREISDAAFQQKRVA